MIRHKFRLLVVFNQLCVFGGLLVDEATQGSIPEELRGYFGLDQSVLSTPTDYNPVFGDLPYALFVGVVFLGLVGAVGLCLGRNWGRRLFVFCIACDIVFHPLTPFYVVTGWGGMVSYLYCITAGMILALVYFSPVRRMFPRELEGAAG